MIEETMRWSYFPIAVNEISTSALADENTKVDKKSIQRIITPMQEDLKAGKAKITEYASVGHHYNKTCIRLYDTKTWEDKYYYY